MISLFYSNSIKKTQIKPLPSRIFNEYLIMKMDKKFNENIIKIMKKEIISVIPNIMCSGIPEIDFAIYEKSKKHHFKKGS